MTQLTNVVQDLFASLGIAQVRKITGTGTTTTSIDTRLAGDGTDEGTLIVVTDAGGDSAAPEGEFARITAFNTNTNAFTHDALTVATAAGDYVMIARNDLPLFDAIECVNRGLRRLGEMILVDTTTLDTASSQTEYAYSVAWKRTPPLRVDIQGLTGDSNDNRWVTVEDWYYVPAAANATGLIVFRGQPPITRDIRVWYKADHPRVATFSAYINEVIHPELLRRAVLLEALDFMVAQAGRGVDDGLVQQRNNAANEFSNARATYKIDIPRHVRTFSLGSPSNYDNSGPNLVTL